MSFHRLTIPDAPLVAAAQAPAGSSHQVTVPSVSSVEVVGGGNTITFSLLSAAAGAPGLSAYQLAASNGFVGTESDWLLSLSGTGISLKYTFSWGDASPVLLTTLQSGKVLAKAEITIQQPFDQPSRVSIGSLGSPDTFFNGDEVDPASAATYQATPGITLGAVTDVYLHITPGVGTSAGNGVIFLYL